MERDLKKFKAEFSAFGHIFSLKAEFNAMDLKKNTSFRVAKDVLVTPEPTVVEVRPLEDNSPLKDYFLRNDEIFAGIRENRRKLLEPQALSGIY